MNLYNSIVRFRDGISRYIITAIDLVSGFAFAHGYSSLSSKSALDFFEKLEKVAPFKVSAIQTDNGSEGSSKCQTSWGKGLVQSVLPINRSRGLALTTARYYTPSGRSIQRDYTHGLDDYYNPEDDKDPKPQGPAFKTDLGRTVYGGGGINPDYAVPLARPSEFMANLRFRHSAFFRYAVHEKDHFGIRLGERADDAVMARFRAWAQEQKLTISDKEWADNLEAMQEQLSIEMQNVAFGVEAGFKLQCVKDPVILKALEVMPEAEALLRKKELLGRPATTTTATLR